MNFASFLSAYLNLNILILVAFVGLFISRPWRKRISFRSELRLHYVVLGMVLVFSFIHVLMPYPQFYSSPAKVWAADKFNNVHSEVQKSSYLSVPTPMGETQISTNWMGLALGGLAFAFFIFATYFMGRDLLRVWGILKGSFLVKRIGRVKVYVSDTVKVPFSFWFFSGAYAVIPSNLLDRKTDFNIALTHELQHHRQHDTQWVYVLWATKWLCYFNPAVHLWNRWMSEVQEFACDETLVDQYKVNSQDYARCLLQVAQSAVHQEHNSVCATGMMFLIERHILKRRIENMLTTSTARTGRSVAVMVGFVMVLSLGATAFAAKGLVQDRRVTLEQAQAMAQRAQGKSDFPIVINDMVLTELNRYLGTPQGRSFMKESLERMEKHRVSVDLYLKKYDMPQELMAIPLIESGYQNLPEGSSSPTVKSAGLWQFIRSTARNYGLRVDKTQDQRMDVGLNTDAAMRYLQSNNLRFKDWHLSVLAYNIGESAVQKHMDRQGTRNAWEISRGIQNDGSTYLPRMMAAILIMNNPDSVE